MPARWIASRTEARSSGAAVTRKLEPSSSTSSGSAVRGRERELVLVHALGVDEDQAAPLEEPRDRARAAQVPVVLAERGADLGGRAVAVVRERLHEHGHPARPVALVHDLLEAVGVGVRAGASRDRALDVVLGHRVGARLLDRVREREVRGRVGPAVTRGDDQRARELREELAALLVRRALLVLDRAPLAMPGHSPPLGRGRETARARACRRSAPGGRPRRSCGPPGGGPARRRARRAPPRRGLRRRRAERG